VRDNAGIDERSLAIERIFSRHRHHNDRPERKQVEALQDVRAVPSICSRCTRHNLEQARLRVQGLPASASKAYCVHLGVGLEDEREGKLEKH
jgi:hypothetical protein